MKWFSACVRMVVLVEGSGTIDARESIFLLRAREYEDAFPAAVKLARQALETEYENLDGQRVRWRVVRLITLDQIDREDLDGAEIWTRGCSPEPGEQFAFDQELRPEDHVPDNSGV